MARTLSKPLPLRLVLTLFFAIVSATLILLLPSIAASSSESPTEVAQVPSTVFEANLAGSKEADPVATDASGRAVLALEETTGTLTSTLHYRVMVHDIMSVTAAHIHQGAPGEDGGIVFPLYDAGAADEPFDPDNPISGTIELTATQQAALLAGDYYINVHTTENPGGEIRGQILQFEPAQDYSALLVGEEETPEVQTDAVGVSRFTMTLTDTGTLTPTLDYYVAVTDITTVTAAHIHTGFRGESGPPVITLYGGDDETRTFGPGEPISGTVELTARNLIDLLTGYYYVNVHTPDNPGGEIRGQVGRAHIFQSSLSGEEETGDVATNATGRSVMALSADAMNLHYRVMVSDITSVTAAHIHTGERDVDGGIRYPLYGGGDEPFDPDNPISGTIALENADEDIFALLQERLYVNVHTEAYMNGEIRGQLTRFAPPEEFFATLTGEKERPDPVETDATGRTRFRLDDVMGHLHYRLTVSNTQNFTATAAHIHRGAADEAGPVVHDLFPTEEQDQLDADNPVGDAVMLEGMDFVDLLTEYFYVNVHTENNAPGEIRGQITTELETLPPEVVRIYLPMVLTAEAAQ